MPAPTTAPPNPNTQTHNPNAGAHSPNVAPNPQLDTIRIGLASLDSNVDQFARHAAHEEVAADKKTGSFWRRMGRSVWNTMMREKALVDKTEAKRDDILENDNLLYHMGESDEKMREATMRRYTSEFGEHLIHEEAGETFHKLGDPENERKKDVIQIRTDINEFLSEYAKGGIDDVSSEAYLDRMFEEWRDEKIGEEFIGEGKILAHNLLEGAKQVKAAYEAAQGLDALQKAQHLQDILDKVEIVAGEAKVGPRTEIEATRTERLAEKMRDAKWINEGRLKRVGKVLGNEQVLAAALAVAFAVGQRGAASAASALAPGLGAGIISAFRERRALRDERALMERRRAFGQETNEKIKAQAELDATLYESRSAGDLLNEIGGLYDQNGDLTIRDRAGLDAALRIQGEISARIRISDREGKNLINFADISAEEMESRRFDLDLAMAKLQTDLKKLFNNPVATTALGIQQGETYEELAATERFIVVGALTGEMDKKDRLFNKLVRKRALKRALITAATATGVGAGIRYGYEFISSAVSNIGAPEMVPVGDNTDFIGGLPSDVTEVGGVKAPDLGPFIGGKAPDLGPNVGGAKAPDLGSFIGDKAPNIGQVGGAEAPDLGPYVGGKAPDLGPYIGGEAFKGNFNTFVLGDKTKIILPEGFRAEKHGDIIKLTLPNGSTFESALEKDGRLSQSTLDLLKNNGVNILHHEGMVQGEPKVMHEKVSGAEFVENHKEDMVKIDHHKWYTQNTRKFDLNELGAQNRLLDNGAVRISIKNMTAKGSFVGKSGLDWHKAAADGHLKVFMSASRGTQSRAFEFNIGTDGEVDVPQGHPARSLFNKEGKFIGGYQEIAVKGDRNPDGSFKIATLATVVGSKHPEINDTIKIPNKVTAHKYVFLPPQPEMSTTAQNSTLDGEYGWFIGGIPIFARRDLGEAKTPPKKAPAAPNNQTNPSNPNGAQSSPNAQTPPGGNPNSQSAPGAQGTPNGTPGAAQNGGQNGPNASQQNKAGNMGGNATGGNTPGGANPNMASGAANPNTSGNTTPNNNQNRQQKQASSSANSRSTGGQTKTNVPPSQGSGPTGQSGPNQTTSPNQGPTRKQRVRYGANGKPNYAYPSTYTVEEQEMLRNIAKDPRDMPDAFKTLQWGSNMNPTAHKIMALVLHDVIKDAPRQQGETYGEWRIRVITGGRTAAQQGLSMLSQVLPGVRPFLREAFETFLDVTEPVPAAANAGNSATSAGAASSSAGQASGATTP